MKRIAQLALFVSMATLLGACHSGSTPKASQTPEQVAEGIKKVIVKDYPGMEVQSVKPVPGFPGVYEVQVDSDIVYMDPSAKYALVGQLIDVKTRANLTERAIEKQAAQEFKNLPFKDAIKEVRGNGKRTLVLFSDPDCPFCKRMEHTLEQMDNLTIYTFLSPITELHPDAARKAKAVWCAEDRLKAWNALMREGQPAPEIKPFCTVPHDVWMGLRHRFKVKATPTLLFPNGKIVAGAMNKEDIEKVYQQIEAKSDAVTKEDKKGDSEKEQ